MLKWINKKRNKKGFTLVELVVVIAILGVLAAIAVPKLSGFTSKAEKQADKVTSQTIKNAVALALADKDIKVSDDTKDATITFTKAGADGEGGTYTSDNITATGQIDTIMKSLTGSPKLKTSTTVVVTIDKTSGEITSNP